MIFLSFLFLGTKRSYKETSESAGEIEVEMNPGDIK